MYWQTNKKRILTILISSLAWAFVAHIMMLTNKYSVFDDSFLFSVGATYTSGRWMLGFLGYLVSGFFMGGHYSLPVINGVLSILFVIGIQIILSDLLEIYHPIMLVALSGICITTPVVTELLGVMFTAPYYTGALCAVSFAIYLLSRNSKWYMHIIAILLITCSMGIYQAVVAMSLSISVVYIIHIVIRKGSTPMNTLKHGLSFLFIHIAALFLYFGINRLVLKVLHLQLDSYKGIDQMDHLSIGSIVSRIPSAYINFFHPANGSNHLYPMGAIRFYYLFLLLICFYIILISYQLIQEKRIYAFLQLAPLTGILPLAINFICVMADFENTSLLPLYSSVLLFFWCADLMETFSSLADPADFFLLRNYRLKNLLSLATVCVVFVLGIIYCRYANVCYLKAELCKSEAISYLNDMVARIRSVEGYTTDLPVVLVTDSYIDDPTLTDFGPAVFSEVHTMPYSLSASDYINAYNVTYYLRNWCGFAPSYLDASAYRDLPEVLSMPHYPTPGAIQILENAVIVKY